MSAIERVKASPMPSPFKLGSVLLIALTLSGYLGEFNRFFELASHFRAQYLFIALTLLIIFLWCGAKKWAMLSLLAFALNAMEVFPMYHPGERIRSDPAEHEFTILLSNVLRTNSGYSRLIELVKAKQPDMLIVLENDIRWVDGLQSLSEQYPYQSLEPRDDYFGIALYSRLPFEAVNVIELGDSGLPSISARIKLPAKEFTVLATHSNTPIGEQNFSLRNQQLAAISSYIRTLSGPRIVIGDLNVSPWSPYFARLLEDSGLVNARQGHGLIASWPTFLPFMMIPIDHCLVSPDVKVIDIDSSSRIGSDHLPILVKLGI